MKYAVTIRATVTKTIHVEADTEDAAIEAAHEEFTTECDGGEENYEQDTVRVEELPSVVPA